MTYEGMMASNPKQWPQNKEMNQTNGGKEEMQALEAIRSVLDNHSLYGPPSVVDQAQMLFQQAVPEIAEKLVQALRDAKLL